MTTSDILEIFAQPLPFDPDAKIFHHFDEETGEEISPPSSYNDFLKQIIDISGINEELLGAIHNQT